MRLEIVTECIRAGEHVFPAYDGHARFNPIWWTDQSAKSPVTYCRLLADDDEVCRAKLLPTSEVGVAYPTYRVPQGGATEIDLFEIRSDLRGHGYGRAAVSTIARAYPGPLVALSLDAQSDSFWRALGWSEHTHERRGRYARLFAT